MEIQFDQNHLLSISNPNIPANKEYFYNVSGYNFSSYDKWLIVLHKKDLKIINLKNLGDNMSVLYLADRKDLIQKKINLNWFTTWLCFFPWFDEKSWERYYFIPKFPENQISWLNSTISKLWIWLKIEKTNKGIFVNWKISVDNQSDFISQLFALILIYWKFDIRNWQLFSFKVHIPLFGSHLSNQEYLDKQIDILNSNWIFFKKDILKTNDGIIYQISSSDYVLLKSFANFYEPIEKIIQIPKYDFTLQIKDELIKFINTNPEIPKDWKSEVLKKLKIWTLKILTK